MDALPALVREVGLPGAIALFVLWRLDATVRANTRAIDSLIGWLKGRLDRE